MMPEPEETQAIPERASRWEDYIDVLFSPAELFRRRANDRLAPPLITLLVASLAIYFLMLPANAVIMQQAMATNPQAAEATQRFGGALRIIGGLFVPVAMAATVFFAAALMWAIARMLEARVTFLQASLIATYASYIALIGQVAVGLLVLLHGPGNIDLVKDLSFGVLRFTGSGDIPGTLLPLLRRVDIFALWQAFIWGIGIHVIGGIGKGRALFGALLVTTLYAIPGVILAGLGLGAGATTT